MNTIQDYLDSGAVDIAPLLSLALNKSNVELIIQSKYLLTPAEKQTLDGLIEQRNNVTSPISIEISSLESQIENDRPLAIRDAKPKVKRAKRQRRR